MMAAWVRALLFVGGGVTAAAGTAYFTGMLDQWLAPPQTLAALPQDPEAKPEPQEQAPPAVTVPQPEDPQTTPKEARLQPPTFDLLRVEPDGSVVIAGKSSPDVSIEVLNGETTIATTTSTPDGDFVAVLDEPLAPGDYQLSLRATSADEVAMSVETAIVSIPETPDGEVLAMVEEPGKPAEIITAPAAPAEEQPAEAGEDVAAAPAEGAEAPAEEEVAAETPAAPEAPAEVAAEDEQPAEEEVAAATPEEPAAAPEDEVAAEEAPVETEVASAPAEAPAEPADEVAAEDEAPAEQEIAALPAEEEQPAAPSQPAVAAIVVVEAVEIEGDTVFVAGSATPGRTVRVYANALYLGDSKASEGGRFLVEAKRELPVGDYIIRADQLEDDGTVIARAAVPFEREPGESIAAVAPPAAPAEAPAEEAEVAAAPADPAPAEPGQGEEGAAEAPAAVEEDVAEAPAEAPAEEEVAEAPAAPAEDDVAEAPAAPAEQPAEAAEAPAEDEEVEVAAAPPAAGDGDVTAPPLQRVDGAVIIRRGDNLWRISRRVYGMGVRYSTIYLANKDQITDPNRIWPGQVFAVPQATPEGEEADLEAMGDQLVPPETESKIIR